MTGHSIRKIIKKNSAEYFCTEPCYTHYRTKEMLQQDHPDLDDTMITICDLRSIDKPVDNMEDSQVPVFCNMQHSHNKRCLIEL